LVKRAVQSALAQTLKEIEIIVVIDGTDEATPVALQEIDDSRLRVIELPTSRGGSGSRNAGVTEAKGEWIAFLDDDDEWLPQKLELQLKLGSSSNYVFPIVTCCLIARTPRADYIWPRRFPLENEPISEYLLARNSFFKGESSIQTSTFFMKRDFFIQNPFKESLLKHQDTEWVLHVGTLENAKFEFLNEPLVIHYIEDRPSSVSSKSNWQYSLRWIQENKARVTPRAYSGFIFANVSQEASAQGDWKAFWPLLQEAIRYGKPRSIDFLIYMGMWLVPRKSRRWLRDSLRMITKT
jgi:glycosyltransferase involved in cell wall biosynthesis